MSPAFLAKTALMEADIKRIIEILRLKPLEQEGGFFKETYRSGESLPARCLPGRYRGPRPYSTAIYFLLTPEHFSAIHRLRSDEVYHFYFGDPVELYVLGPGSGFRCAVLGPGLNKGMRPQATVRRGRWQGARLVPGGRYALLGTTVSPGFDFRDFEIGIRGKLLETFPGHRRIITEMTREPG